MNRQKKYWLREEISIADDLMELVPKLRDEFLEYHKDFLDGDYKEGIPVTNYLPNNKYVLNDPHAWKAEPMKYTWDREDVQINMYEDDRAKKNFPTAVALTKKWAQDSGIIGYSILEKNATLYRHTGKENRDSEYLRVHIPLLIPEGDIYFECEGVEINWDDIWGFNNQLIHSAYNHTDQRRLVYLIDVRRSAIGLPPEPPFNAERETKIPPYVRGALPTVYHTCQLDKMSPEDREKAVRAMQDVI